MYGVHTWVVYVCVGRCVRIRNCLREGGGRQDNAKDALPLCRRHAHMSPTLACTVHTTRRVLSYSMDVSSALRARRLPRRGESSFTLITPPAHSSLPAPAAAVDMSQRRNNILQNPERERNNYYHFLHLDRREGSCVLHQYLLRHHHRPTDRSIRLY